MKKAIITGIRRIGYNIALELLKEGWLVGLVYLGSERIHRELSKAYPGKVWGFRANLSRAEECTRAVEELLKNMEGVDAFVHLASPYEPTPIHELKEELIDYHFKPIAQAFILIAKELYPVMLKNEGIVKGRMVAFGDWATNTTPYRNYAAYFIAKGALHTAVKVLAKEFAPHVIVNGIALGPTVKPEGFSSEKWQEYINKTPLKRPVSLEDVIKVTKLLLDVESITGELINLDSGRHISGECS
ncbi:MAG: SDR family oxidoreductase [Acidobacteria bacterium]|jgi:NAD(P)-dependent dehydrogenase (short-subunit alcohol dehydrogenase family)|nr:MAG: SDR family oxidoreductase [Acidobacteriota bacterium]